MAEDAVRVFISYSHRDETLRLQLDKHLAPLKGQKVIESWHDRQIQAGMEWADQIDDNLNKADIILLLVSPDFVASDYCFKIELIQAIKRHESGEAIVVPIILEPCDWSWLPFAKFQAFPKDAKAITTWANSNEAFLDVATGIRKVAQELFAKRKLLAEQKQADRARYLQKVEEVLSDGVISIVERDTLDELRETLGLMPEEAREIETRAYEPYSRVEENLNKYKQTLNRLIEKGYYPFSEEIEKDLENRQRDLGLKPEDAARISKPILDRAELDDQAKKKQLTEAEKLQALERQRQQEQQEYEAKLKRYRQEFSKAVEAEYPLNNHVVEGLRHLRQQLGLKTEDFAQIERSIRELAEAKYQKNLKQQSEAERQRQIELEQQRQAEKEEYKAKLQRYEQEFSKLIAVRYPMTQSTLDWLKKFQQQLGLKDEDIARVEQLPRESKEADYQHKLREAETVKSNLDFSLQSTSDIKLQRFKFDVITVDKKGNENTRTKETAEFFAEDLGNGVVLEMVKIPSGTFQMGSPEGQGNDDEKPQHAVTVPAFAMGKYPVTQAQWRAVADLPQVEIALNADPSNFKGDSRPVEKVSWDEAVEFCQRLSRVSGHLYHLPSEAEWEYACRAGTTTEFYFGETLTPKLARCKANLGMALITLFAGETVSVGSYLPNTFGLYDMRGNVCEWCADPWHGNYQDASTDGSVWTTNGDNEIRVIRGGSWHDYPVYCRSAYRYYSFPRVTILNIGFRVVCSSPRTFV